jgi:glycosyltransferase involved in cell wall biosynthesis
MLRTDQSLCPGPDMGKNCMTHCQIPDVGKRLRTHIPLLKSAKKILSPSAALANLFKSNLPDVNVEVLNHGMNYDTIQVNERGYQPGDPLTLFYGGSLNSHKGVDLILKAMALIPSDRLQLKIYGSGPDDYTESLEQAAAADDRVTLCGPYTENDIQQLYQKSISPSSLPSGMRTIAGAS